MEHKLKFFGLFIMAALFATIILALAYGAYRSVVKPIFETGGWHLWLLIAGLSLCAWVMAHAWRKGVRHG